MFAIKCAKRRVTELMERVRIEIDKLTKEKIQLIKTPPQLVQFQQKLVRGKKKFYPVYMTYGLVESDQRYVGYRAVTKMLPVYQKILDTLLDIRSFLMHQENIDKIYSHLSSIFAYTDLVIEPFLKASEKWQWTDVDLKILTKHPLHAPRTWMKSVLKGFLSSEQKRKTPTIKKKVRFTLPT